MMCGAPPSKNHEEFWDVDSWVWHPVQDPRYCTGHTRKPGLALTEGPQEQLRAGPPARHESPTPPHRHSYPRTQNAQGICGGQLRGS